MELFKVKVGKSKILKNQKGLFATEDIPKKSPVFIFSLIKDLKIISEKEFNKSWTTKTPSKKDLVIRKSGVRYIGDLFLYGKPEHDKKSIYINHSDKPNLLYHCGICFAKKDIKNNDELTVDYRYFDTEKSDNFFNVETGNKLERYNSEEVFIKSTQELLRLLKF